MKVNEVKQRGILYSAPMVQANLQGIKTQTRRTDKYWLTKHFTQDGFKFLGTDIDYCEGRLYGSFRWTKDPNDSPIGFAKCPYGIPGDILYGRETWAKNPFYNASDDYSSQYSHQASGDFIGCHKWKPSIHMPKLAARIWTEITDIRMERLHDITTADAIAEGIDIFRENGYYVLPIKKTAPVGKVRTADPVDAYLMLFNMINGTTMQDNPYNWVIEYKKIEKPVAVKEVAGA
jgi:hypothetical protein